MTKEQRLNEQVGNHKEKISYLQTRVSTLSDKLMMLETDVGRFKKQISVDLKAVVDHLKKNK
jgi:phage shock protein A